MLRTDDAGRRTPDNGRWTLDDGRWTLDAGPSAPYYKLTGELKSRTKNTIINKLSGNLDLAFGFSDTYIVIRVPLNSVHYAMYLVNLTLPLHISIYTCTGVCPMFYRCQKK